MRGTPTSAAMPAILDARRRARAGEILQPPQGGRPRVLVRARVGKIARAVAHVAKSDKTILPTRSSILRHVRHGGGLSRCGLLARARRVERGVLLAAQRLARELDQVVRGEAHAEHRLDLALLERGLRRLPE